MAAAMDWMMASWRVWWKALTWADKRVAQLAGEWVAMMEQLSVVNLVAMMASLRALIAAAWMGESMESVMDARTGLLLAERTVAHLGTEMAGLSAVELVQKKTSLSGIKREVLLGGWLAIRSERSKASTAAVSRVANLVVVMVVVKDSKRGPSKDELADAEMVDTMAKRWDSPRAVELGDGWDMTKAQLRDLLMALKLAPWWGCLMEMMMDVKKGVMMVATKDMTAEVLMDDLLARTMGRKGVATRVRPMVHELETK